LEFIVAGKSGLKFFFLPKTSFSTRFDSKHRRNHDKTTYDLKKPPKKPKSIRIQKSTRAHICFFTNFKGTKTLLWTPLVKWNYLTKI
jgi:hypothetical protein